jgi:hypothetical protein
MSKPLCNIDSKQYPAATNRAAAKLPAEGDRSAVLVVHGMGQQRKFETLSDVADGIGRIAGEAKPKEARNVRIGDERLSRVELQLQDGRQVDVYEAYWAPFTEGQVTLRDVMAFLWAGARNGIRNARKPFRRWIFGQHLQLPGGKRTLFYLIVATAVLASLVFINSLTLLLGATKAMSSTPSWLEKAAIEDITSAILMFLCTTAGFAALYFAAAHQKKPGGGLTKRLAISRLGIYYFFGLCFEIVTVTVAMLLAIALHRHPTFWGVAAWTTGTLLVSLTAVLLVAAAVVTLASLPRSQKRGFDLGLSLACVALAGFTVLLAAVRAGQERSIFDMIQLNAGIFAPAILWISARWVAIWIALAWVSKQAREFLVQYLGDVAAYVSPSALDRFDSLRDRIKECTFKTANAIYRAEENGGFAYRNVAIVGHSLGSVAAYDCLNRMLSEDTFSAGALRVRARTSGLITFGSPLDKTAFLFELNTTTSSSTRAALATTVQPLIADMATLSIPWTNIYSPSDIIGGDLDFYGTDANSQNRVVNEIDHDAVTPLGAHTEYWKNTLLWRTLNSILPPAQQALAAPLPLGPAAALPPAPPMIAIKPVPQTFLIPANVTQVTFS